MTVTAADPSTADPDATTESAPVAFPGVGRRKWGLRRRILLIFTLGALMLSLFLAFVTYGFARSSVVQQRDLDAARNAYQRAVELNRALLAAWRELAKIHQVQGDDKLYGIANAEFERLSALPTELVTVTGLIQENKLYHAEQLCREFLKKTPHQVEAMRLLALIGMQLFVYDDAEFLRES